ncbi:unnamed protein product [Ilex paraguariensis]|uniref:ABC transmembrane type-1 domain-containing protein n=1 Tax=Ilex paraguariensis TaxID=185542 RepID=A0ABC8RK99_9AQUA
MEGNEGLPEKTEGSGNPRRPRGSLRTVLKHSDWLDMLLMAVGTIGCVADGLSMSVIMLVLSQLMNGYASVDSPLNPEDINKYALALLYVAVGIGSGAFLENSLRIARRLLNEQLVRDTGMIKTLHWQFTALHLFLKSEEAPLALN